MILDNINKPGDIKEIDKENLPALADEIREFLIDKISKTGGHLASNLGVVELTMALHLSLDLPEDHYNQEKISLYQRVHIYSLEHIYSY